MSGVPHSPQNFTVGPFAAPQDGQGCASGDPHSPQNFRPASLAVPQEGQGSESATGKLYCAHRSCSIRAATLLSVALLDSAETRGELTPNSAWWLRVPAVLLSPHPVFFALREDDPDDVAARSEPVLLLVLLAGVASVLATSTARGLLDNPDYDALLLAVWAFVAGGIYGVVGYFVGGFALFFGTRLLGSLGSFRRERHIVAFAVAPLALSFFLLVPIRLALYGSDTFRAGGADEGTGETVLLVVQLVFAAWSLALLFVGVRVVHGWPWSRALGAVGAGAALLAALVGVFAIA